MSAREKWTIPHRSLVAETQDLAAQRIRELLLAMFQRPETAQGAPVPGEGERRPENIGPDVDQRRP